MIVSNATTPQEFRGELDAELTRLIEVADRGWERAPTLKEKEARQRISRELASFRAFMQSIQFRAEQNQ